MRRMLAAASAKHRISGIEYEGCYFITFKMISGSAEDLIETLLRLSERGELCAEALVGANEAPVFEKYDDYIPSPLLQHAYATDKLNAREAESRLADLAKEFKIGEFFE